VIDTTLGETVAAIADQLGAETLASAVAVAVGAGDAAVLAEA
jgi:hypothetical protein